MQYTDLRTDAYTETGDPALNLKVDAQQYDFLQSGLGRRFRATFRCRGLGCSAPSSTASGCTR
uniref:Autotransporter outer membrane beta-barrel domain-containing protein n=1 Tax=Phenylobacterium glaciei TaxID=2803784 RepID=A0A974P660_9CAUL|nr:autotransporter outer membrane beta-barrel domain-containing protein [Phenylobacterium glaciei]